MTSPPRFRRREILAAILASPLAATPARAGRDGAPDWLELPIKEMERLDANVWIARLSPDVWVICSTFEAPKLGWVPCNGLIVGTPSGVTVVDTGNTWQQGGVLLKAAQRVTGKRVERAIVTHFHGDRTGGTASFLEAGIPVLGNPLTVGLSMAYGQPVPQPIPALERGPVDLGPIELFYPGPGHTRDNITVWHKESRCLFGGCLLRATTDKQIGSKTDADMDQYLSTIDRLARRYPQRDAIVPGHGAIAGDAVQWTRTQVEAYLSRDNNARQRAGGS